MELLEWIHNIDAQILLFIQPVSYTHLGVIAPGYTEEALEVLKQKKKGNYNVIQIDPEYVPAPLEHKQVFGVTFEQGRQELAIDDELISNIVTENKESVSYTHLDVYKRQP